MLHFFISYVHKNFFSFLWWRASNFVARKHYDEAFMYLEINRFIFPLIFRENWNTLHNDTFATGIRNKKNEEGGKRSLDKQNSTFVCISSADKRKNSHCKGGLCMHSLQYRLVKPLWHILKEKSRQKEWMRRSRVQLRNYRFTSSRVLASHTLALFLCTVLLMFNNVLYPGERLLQLQGKY